MSRKFIVAMAAAAALGTSTLLATDASARFGGFAGGGHFSGARVGSFSRANFSAARITTNRTVTRTFRANRVTNFSRVNRPPALKHPPHAHFAYGKHHHHWWWTWCRFHHHHRCGYPWIEVGVDGDVPVDVADAPVAATPAAAVCTNDCDYFIKNEPGCYMAKRAFSTPAGDELRCVKICEDPENTHAAK